MAALWSSLPYISVRLGMWAILWGLSLLDFIMHKGEKVHGWQLHRCILSVLTLILVKEVLIIVWSVITDGGDSSSSSIESVRSILLLAANTIFYVLLLFWHLADASFQSLLMLISYGWQITRDRISGGAWAILIAPLLYFIASVTHNYVWILANSGDESDDLGGGYEMVMFVASLVYICTVVFMWQWTFQSTQAEKERLEAQLNKHQTENSPELDDTGYTSASGNDITVSHVVSPTDGTVMEGEDHSEDVSGVLPHHNDNEDVDQDDSWREEIATESANTSDVNMTVNAKLQLMRRFWWAVCFYFIASVLLMVVSLFNTDGEEHLEVLHSVILVGHNLTYFVFLAGLCFIFRLREHNPYFLLGGDYDTSLWGDEERGLEDQQQLEMK